MFNHITVFLYFLIISLCLFFALLRRKNNPFPIYIYFLLVAVIEIIAYFLKGNSLIYQLASLFYVLFFTFYYANFTSRLRNAVYILGGISFFSILYYFLQFESNFPTEIGITVSILYVVFSFMWFYDQITNPGKAFILSKQVFWISAANFLWGVIFLFRVSLMYWLAKNDPAFLVVLDKIFKVFVILTDLLLLVGVTRKQYVTNE